jgi:hypothetical protein
MATDSHGLTGVRHHGQSAQIMQTLLPASLLVMLGAVSRLLNLEKRIRFKIRRELLFRQNFIG